MDWTKLVIFLVTFAGMFVWNRAESRADVRHFDQASRETRELVHSIQLEMRDFHNKLLEIERGRR